MCQSGSSASPAAVQNQRTMLAQDECGNELLELRRLPEHDLGTLTPLTHACVVARRADGCLLMVFDRWKQQWELPGGAIEPGEEPRNAAVRELREEANASASPASLTFLGAIVLRVGPNRHDERPHVEFGALYAVAEPRSGPFVPDDEIAAVLWWNGRDEIGAIGTFDRALLAIA